MRNAVISIGLSLLFVLLISVNINAQCDGNFNQDRNIDNADLVIFAQEFGRTDCETVSPCEADVFPIGAPDGVVDESDLAVFPLTLEGRIAPCQCLQIYSTSAIQLVKQRPPTTLLENRIMRKCGRQAMISATLFTV